MPSQAGPEGLPCIPAMTTDAERECYYRLAKEAAPKGEIVELGAWLGASTAYIAAGVRDSGAETKVKVFDKFQTRPGHKRKVEEFYSKRTMAQCPLGPAIVEFQQNLGPLMRYVEWHQGKIENEIKREWADNSISLLVSDAPKRVPQISPVLTALRKALQPGAIMAWQDFCHFPSYEIPACLYRIREHLEFVEAIVPGTTLVFRVKSQWNRSEVAMAALDLGTWTHDEIVRAWAHWIGKAVPPEKAGLFSCGAAMFLCDIGLPEEGAEWLRSVYESNGPQIVKKWRYLREARPDFLIRYAPLFEYLERQGVFEKEPA